MKIQPLRGTRDLLGDQIRAFREVESHFSQLAKVYDFAEIETPICEPTQTFKRSLGETTDIINKEMYTFEDRGGDSITMRPEGTAPVARALISNGLTRELPAKFFYSGPMFRYERPQKGRYRQFYQFGVEFMGVAEPIADIEVLALAHHLFKSLGLQQKVQLELNTIGDSESRQAYRDKLVSYFSKYKADLSEDSQRRLETNPLRILDSKDAKDKELVKEAPDFDGSLNSLSKKFFAEVCQGLEDFGIPYQRNPRLVRGLDYYNHSVFEFTTDALGSQNAVLSGGRYDNLVKAMGGPEIPGVGWAGGTDRMALLLEKPKTAVQSLGLVAMDSTGEKEAITAMQSLRDALIPCQIFYGGNAGKKLKKADKRNCSHVLLFGESERAKQSVTAKNLKTGDQFEVPLSEMVEKIKTIVGSHS